MTATKIMKITIMTTKIIKITAVLLFTMIAKKMRMAMNNFILIE